MTRRTCHLLTVAALLLSAAAVPAAAECVFLKNGGIIRGRITGENGTSITVKPVDGAARTIGRGQVLRTLYTDIYLGRVVVRLTDGTSREAYIVDENADSYIFRDQLDRVEEYAVPRKKVLFIARTNPTDLRGRTDTTSIWVTWYPPYKPPKSYRVYYREKGSARFETAGTTGRLSYTVRGLKKKTRYRIMVTALDETGGESLPTDEIEIMTNTPPGPPRGTRLARLPLDGGRLPVNITWRPAVDPDGTIKNYRILALRGDTRVLIGDTAGTAYAVSGLDPGTIHHFAVRSVDNDEVESDEARVNTRVIEFDITVRGSYLMPVRGLGEILNPGYGGLAIVSAANFPAWCMNIGLGSGYFYFTGWGRSVGSSLMIPLFAAVSYRFMITDSFSVAPEVFGGCSFIRISYTKKFASAYGVIYPSRQGGEPFVMAGLTVSYSIQGRYMFYVGADYGAVFERKNIMDFIAINAGFGARI
jgi:hypothetical protein